MSFKLIPLNVIAPLSTSSILRSKLVIVLFPEPLSPTNATVCFSFMSMFIFSNIVLFLS